MSKKSDTDEPTEYDDQDATDITDAVDSAWGDYDEAGGSGSPRRMNVDAQVEWSGVLDRRRNGHRHVNFGIDRAVPLRELKKPLDTAREANRRLTETAPAARRQAKGWHAQLREITGAKYGTTAADKAGLSPSQRTLRAWLAEDVTPSKANRERIAEAYEALRNRPVEVAAERAKQAQRALAETLNHVLREGYGAEIRIRNITGMEFED